MKVSEIWRDVVGYEGFYKVSNKGNVYSVERISLQGRKIGGRILKPSPNSGGYLLVGLCKNGKTKKKYIHRLVAEAFLPNPENHPQINHIDELKDNNELSNLEWCDSRYNVNYGTLIERLSKKIRTINIKTGEVFTFSSVKEAVSKGYSHSAVSASCNGIYKNASGKLIGDGHTYKGHRWSYE